MSLKEKAESMNSGVKVDFMKGRESGKMGEILGKKYTIIDYDFLKDDKNEEYAVFILDEIKDKRLTTVATSNINLEMAQRIMQNIDNTIKDMDKGYVLERCTFQCKYCDFLDYCKYEKEIK